MGAKPDRTPLTDTAIYEVPVDALTPYPGNPRIGSTEAIAESLQTNGQYRPIVVRRETREILAGNHTWKAAKSLGWETIHVTYLDNLTDEQAAKIVLADNRLPDLGRYNTPDLTALIEQVSGDLTGTGYDPYFVQNLLTSLDSIETAPVATDSDTPASATPAATCGSCGQPLPPGR